MESKITKAEFLARRAAAAPQPTQHELLRAEQDRLYEEEYQARFFKRVVIACAGDEVLAKQMIDGGGMVELHKIGHTLPYDVFHDIAHVFVGSGAAYC